MENKLYHFIPILILAKHKQVKPQICYLDLWSLMQTKLKTQWFVVIFVLSPFFWLVLVYMRLETSFNFELDMHLL